MKQAKVFVGTQLVIDLYEAKFLDDIEIVQSTLLKAVKACKATLIDIHVLQFPKNKGITGVALLAESHISIHTWPEFAKAAVDIFVCGNSDPWKAIPIFRSSFRPGRLETNEYKRCEEDENSTRSRDHGK